MKEALQAEGVPAGDAAVALAELKAERVAAQMSDAIVLGADQGRAAPRGPRGAHDEVRQAAFTQKTGGGPPAPETG